MRRLAIVVAVMALFATACGDDSSSTTATNTNEPVTITLLTHDSFAVSKGLLESFTDQTGITVKVLQAGDDGCDGEPGDPDQGEAARRRAVRRRQHVPDPRGRRGHLRAVHLSWARRRRPAVRRSDRERRRDPDRLRRRVPQLRQGLLRQALAAAAHVARGAHEARVQGPAPSSRTRRPPRPVSRSCSARSIISARRAGSTTGSS